MVIFAATLTNNHSGIRVLSIVAAVTNILALALALALALIPRFTYNHMLGQSERQRRPIFLLGIIPFSAAAATTIVTLGCMEINLKSLPQSILGRPTSTILISAFGVLGTSIFTEFAFYSFLLWSLHTIAKQRHPSSSWNGLGRGLDVQRFIKSVVRPLPEPSGPSPTRSTTPSDAKRTLRSSLSSVVRPVISRTKLITRDSTSLDGSSRDDVPESGGFDSWDTSGVGSQARQAVLISSLTDVEHLPKGAELEPIPGSRSGSPIFWPCHHSESDSDQSKPQGPSDLPNGPGQFLGEAHIHPLFRSDSPTPPPTASPGTIVRASPLSGQVFNCSIRTLKQVQPGVLTSKTSPSVKPHSFDKDTAVQRPTSIEIPPSLRDFILPPSPRSNPTSPNRYGKQKTALSSTTEESMG
ncbi:MAG: hypothetical protein M1813_002995 [Trichoglossum hirsutum]|nr:MAG: hypothetical protein M1813_002995 [Trichoglossum hirsutum]